MRLKPPQTPTLADPIADQVRRTHEQRIAEMQALPAVGLRTIANIELADGVDTPVPHKLGRLPAFVTTSCPRGATATGRIVEVRSATYDRRQQVVLRATGHGATITVDVLVL